MKKTNNILNVILVKIKLILYHLLKVYLPSVQVNLSIVVQICIKNLYK